MHGSLPRALGCAAALQQTTLLIVTGLATNGQARPARAEKGNAAGNARFVDDGRPVERAHEARGVVAAKLDLPARLLGGVGVEVDGERGRVQHALVDHVEERRQRLHVGQVREAQALRARPVHASAPSASRTACEHGARRGCAACAVRRAPSR